MLYEVITFTLRMCCRPTRAATWTFWSASAAPACRGTRIEAAMTGAIENGAIYPSLENRAVFVTGGGGGIV